jgi:hypothetical protein
MLRKFVSISIYTYLMYVLQSSADNVTLEKILDLTVFGTCNIYLKRFREDQGTVDLTEKLILVQQKLRTDYALTTIDNTTRILPMANPTVNLFEGCILNIILGIVPRDTGRLTAFMYDNYYTYSSTPFSTYILIPDAFNAKASVHFSLLAMLELPLRIFCLLVPTVPHDKVNLYSEPYILVCAQCVRSSLTQKMPVNADLAYISSLNFSDSWSRNDVQIANLFYKGSRDITGCEHFPWATFSEAHKRSDLIICNGHFAFIDVLVRSVGSNFTVSLKYKKKRFG